MKEPAATDKSAKPTPADSQAAIRLKSIWDRQKATRKAVGQKLVQSQVADILDSGQSAISQYLRGVIPLNYRAVLAFSEVLGIPPTDIRSDLPEQQLAGSGAEGPVATMPIWDDITAYGQQVAAGDGMTTEEYAETNSLKFKRSSLRKKGLYARKLSIFYASGDSMEPRIHDGDALLFDNDDTKPKDGLIYVIKHHGDYFVKRLHQYGDRWFMVSDNPSDPKWRKPIPVDFDDGFEVLGRVRWIGSWED